MKAVKAQVEILKGYRRLRKNEKVKMGSGQDLWFNSDDMTWNEYGQFDQVQPGDYPIRKVKPPAGGKGKP